MNTAKNTGHLNWMADTPHIHALRIDELILPGTHNSGSDKQSPNFGVPQEFAQDESPLEQLRRGIRVLDLRVAFYKSYPVGDPRRFQLFHLTSSGRTVAVDIVEAVHTFLSELEHSTEAAREIVILDFHQLQDFTDQAHDELQAMVFNVLGDRIIPYALNGCTLEQLWNRHPGKNVVIAYNAQEAVIDAWVSVSQRWPGEILFNTNTLKNFADQVAKETKPALRLHAIQCAKYSLPLHAPTDLSHKVDQWFESVDENSYIQNFYIINTDWTSRSQLVANCRHANAIRGARKVSHPDEALQPMRR